MRYAIAAFLIFWLGGWTMGWLSAVREITLDGKGGAFLLFWLAGWTVGGGFAIVFLWKLLRRPVAETVVFAKPNLIYDTGVQPFPISWSYRQQMDIWKKMFEKRKRIEFSPDEIRSVRLRDIEADNRLTMDHGTERIDIGRTLTEVEREWLFKLISEEYKV